MINTKIYSTSDRQWPTYCALKCDNKQRNQPIHPKAGEEKFKNWRSQDQVQIIPKKSPGLKR